MIIGYGAFAGCPASGSWETWCDCSFPSPELNAKCKNKPWSIASPPPWTVVGRQIRGLPAQEGTGGGILDSVLSIVGGGGPSVSPTDQLTTGTPPPPADEGIFGIPKTVALVGGVVLLGGLASFVLLRRRRSGAMGSYKRRIRRRRK